MNYYNDFDKGAAAWLRELIKAGLIPNGYVDDRSITEVTPADLEGFTQCHFFAGIGGWSYALQLAGIPANTRLWTGSPPCQPFSVAGKQLGQLDERHLAPTFMRLVAKCQPPVLFGEQVAAAIGKHWLDDLFTELEREGYACGAAVLPAASVGAPHKRDRLFFGASLRLGDATGERQCTDETGQHSRAGQQLEGPEPGQYDQHRRTDGELADPVRQQLHRCRASREGRRPQFTDSGSDSSMADTHDARPQGRGGVPERADQQSAGASGLVDSMEQPGGQRRKRWQTSAPGHQHDGETPVRAESEHGAGEPGAYRFPENSANPYHGFWSDADWLGCRDGKFRPVESGTFPLAHGIPARVGRLRGYGNAICPQVAAEFIKAFTGAVADAGN